jgi:hypothetical protein
MMFNLLIQAFANGATGFNVFDTQVMHDMALWLAMRDAIALVTPFEDLICDGTPLNPLDHGDTFKDTAPSAVVSAMVGHQGSLLIASSTIPHGTATHFSIHVVTATPSWILCDLMTNETSATPATWSTQSEGGALLLYGPATPCHDKKSEAPEAKPESVFDVY